jgi:cullin 1
MAYYDQCFKLCTAEKEVELYKMAAKELEKNVLQQLEKIKRCKGEALLSTYLKLYLDYRQESQSIHRIFAYLHRFWIPNQKNAGEKVLSDDDKVREVYQLALVQWRKYCFGNFADQLRQASLGLLDEERDGQQIDRNLVKNFVDLLNDLAVDQGIAFYENHFEKQCLIKTKEYYLKESSAFLQSGTVSDYMQKAENRIRKEEENGVFYFLPTTKPKLKLALDEAMITKHFDQLQNAFQDMIEHEEENDMRRFYFLFSRLDDGLQNSARTFQAHLKKVGTAIMAQQKAIKDTKKAIANAIPFIKELLVLHGKYLRIINTCFTRDGDLNGDPLFQQAMDKAFTEIVNLPTGKFTMARLLSFYTDKVLSGKEKVEDHEINSKLEEVARLFSYFQDKDSFAEYVRKGLCKRLLGSDKEFNEAHEQTFISKLKERCGNNYTRHLQGMFADINDAASKAIADGFVEWNKSDKVGKVDLSVTVLNESHWPITGAEKFPLALSQPLTDCVSKFEEYYKSKTDKRKLRWLFNHGTVVLATHYGKGKVQVEVTPIQACILQLFEKEKVITFENMVKNLWPEGQAAQKGVQSNAETLKFAIAPLIQTKGIAPIKRSGEGKELSENDKFGIRSEIKTKKRRLKFAGGSAAKTDSESKDVEKSIDKQREFEIDAAMVRIMKSRNVLSWNELTSESIRALKDRFQPNPRMLKRRLESLIEREFMARDQNDAKIIRYVA